MFVVTTAVITPFWLIMFAMMPAVDSEGAQAFPVAIFAMYPILYLVIFSVSAWMLSGMYHAAFKQIRGEQISVGDLFSGGSRFLPMAGAVVLIAIMAGVGSIFCLIPGLIVYGMTFLTYPLIVEGNKGTIEALQSSFETTKGDWLMFTLFAFVTYLVAAAGALLCGVGMLATLPLMVLVPAVAYRSIFGLAGASGQDRFQPPAPPPGQWATPQSQQPAQPQMPPRPQPQFQPPPQPRPQPPPERPATVNCPHCGASLSRSANFCNQCGNPLSRA
jgi:hypothetical protein